jgi:hypothetical protein
LEVQSRDCLINQRRIGACHDDVIHIDKKIEDIRALRLDEQTVVRS